MLLLADKGVIVLREEMTNLETFFRRLLGISNFVGIICMYISDSFSNSAVCCVISFSCLCLLFSLVWETLFCSMNGEEVFRASCK